MWEIGSQSQLRVVLHPQVGSEKVVLYQVGLLIPLPVPRHLDEFGVRNDNKSPCFGSQCLRCMPRTCTQI